MRDHEGQVGGRTEKKTKERDTSIEGAVVGLQSPLGIFPGILKDGYLFLICLILYNV